MFCLACYFDLNKDSLNLLLPLLLHDNKSCHTAAIPPGGEVNDCHVVPTRNNTCGAGQVIHRSPSDTISGALGFEARVGGGRPLVVFRRLVGQEAQASDVDSTNEDRSIGQARLPVCQIG